LALVALSVVEQRLDAVRVVLAGASVTEVASKVGVSRQSVHTVKCWMFVMRLSSSGKAFYVAYGTQAQEAFLEHPPSGVPLLTRHVLIRDQPPVDQLPPPPDRRTLPDRIRHPRRRDRGHQRLLRSRVELFEESRRDRRREGLSIRELSGRHQVHRRTVPPDRPPRRRQHDVRIQTEGGATIGDDTPPHPQAVAPPRWGHYP
jgi:hypothetical protein